MTKSRMRHDNNNYPECIAAALLLHHAKTTDDQLVYTRMYIVD